MRLRGRRAGGSLGKRRVTWETSVLVAQGRDNYWYALASSRYRLDSRRTGSRLVRRTRQGPAVARPRRDSVVGAGQRDHAPADPGEPRAPGPPGLAGTVA